MRASFFALEPTVPDPVDILRAYHAPLADHPDPARRVGWRNQQHQNIRFAACLSALGLRHTRSILDVGCGLGDLAGWVRRLGYRGEYLGLDVLPEMVSGGMSRWPGESFAVADLTTNPQPAPSDLVVACGTLSLQMPDHARWVAKLLRAMWAHTTRVLVVVVPHRRALASQPGGPDAAFHHYSPAELRTFLTALTPRVTIREDLLDTDLIGICTRQSPILREMGDWCSPVDVATAHLACNEPLQVLDVLRVQDQSAEVCVLRGRAHRALGDENAARNEFLQALRMDPTRLDAQLELEGV